MSDENNVTFSTDATTPEVPAKRLYTLVFLSDLLAGDRLEQTHVSGQGQFRHGSRASPSNTGSGAQAAYRERSRVGIQIDV